MFKKLLYSIFAFFLLIGAAEAQVNYTFSAATGTFTSITGTTATLTPNCGYTAAQGDEGFQNAVAVGFTFAYNGVNYSTINLATNGLASLGSGFVAGATACSYDNTSGLTNNANVTTGRPILAPFWDDLDVASIVYTTTGTSPNRVFTAQWNTAKWDYSAAAGSLTFQLKIYETTNVIEFIYRQDAGTPANLSGGASIGLTAVATGSGNFLSLNNASAAPTASSTTETTSIGTRPATGQIYRWTPLLCVNPTVTPTSASLCAGSVQQFSLVGAASGTQAVTSNAVITISAIGAVNGNPYPSTLAVSGLPTTGVTVQSVSLNGFSHTYVSDLAIVLVSPTGTPVILMADVGGSSASTNANYVFSDGATASMGTAAIASGTYKPTNLAPNPDNFPAPGPGSLTQPVNPLLSSFTGNVNGNWQVFVVDKFNGDGGTINGFTITFGLPPAPITGTWSPVAGLFTNAGATTPYVANTQASTVYAKPTVTTTYTVTVVNGSCNNSTNFTVTVSNPPSFTTQPTAKTVCESGSTSFTAATASAATFQWQDSIPGGSWQPITGQTTGTLTLTNIPLSFNNRWYRVLAGAAPCTGVASSAVRLTVNARPLINLSASPYTRLFPGLQTTITANTTPSLTTGFTWYKNGALITGNSTNKITTNVDGQGAYTAIVTDANGCTSLISNELVIGDSLSTKLFVYPNPNRGIFQVRYYSVPNNNLVRGVVVYDDKGSRVLVQETTVGMPYGAMDINLTRFKSGTYWVMLTDGNGKRIEVAKVVVM